MSSEKRLVLTLVLTLGSVYGIRFAMERAGLIPPEQEQPAPAAVAQGDPAKGKAKAGPEAAPRKADAELPDHPFAPEDPAPRPSTAGVKQARPGELVLGSDQDEDPAAYRLRLVLDQKGAAVDSATSAQYEAELDPAAPRPKGRLPRLRLIGRDDPRSGAPGSLSITLASASKAAEPDSEDAMVRAASPEVWLDQAVWEVVRDKDDAPAVRTSTRPHPVTKVPTESQELTFRTTSASPAVTVTKTYRIWKGDDGFEVELKFASPTDAKFQYRLFGPHGIPIEGEWYTSTFRDVFIGQVKGNSTDIWTKSSYDVVKYDKDPSYRLSTLPTKFAGVEDQYFATLVGAWPVPRSNEDRWDQEAAPVVFQLNKEANQKSDVGVEIVSKPIAVGPNLGEVVHTYRVFAGPKITSALLPYEAEELASYRKQYIPIPGATWLAKNVIAPLLDRIYALTQSVARTFGWKNGNYGIAIILLTMTVRLIMFPLGRKQAMMAKKMQDLQPVLAEVKEKYKDDKEALTRETMAVWKRHKVNPAAGCLPALIQMPIFVGLWQSLNNSVALRHSTFLYIRDLAAPDMLFRLPTTLPFGIGEYFNLLPFLVVSLMLVQTKLFAPPPTTPEAEMNQKMMKYMMIFMAFMFYKVPSGLGLYFITSSLWQIGERLLLPKIIAKAPETPADGDDREKGRGPGGPGGSRPGPDGNGNGGGAQGWLGKRLEKILEEAAKDKTIRNDDRGRERDRDRDRDRDRPRPNKPRPGKRR